MHPGGIAEQVLLDKEESEKIGVLLLDEDQPGERYGRKDQDADGGKESENLCQRPEIRRSTQHRTETQLTTLGQKRQCTER
jgi:hypothetical protein